MDYITKERGQTMLILKIFIILALLFIYSLCIVSSKISKIEENDYVNKNEKKVDYACKKK